MLKKVIIPLLLLLAVLLLAMPSLAAFSSVIYDKDIKSTDEFLVKITRPEGDETTFKRSYVICGNTTLSGIRVELAIEDSKGTFVPFYNTDDESGWDVGQSGIFMKEVVLPETGANRIRIAAFQKANSKNLVAGENLQIKDYTITVLEQSFKDRIKNGVLNVTEALKTIFKVK
ncbi:MAG: hypothetical protein N2489_09795 [Clostridia bacterium]|nr:hypothetical protein [Clostridia bacterium]